jgi:6-phosphofructokinase 1
MSEPISAGVSAVVAHGGGPTAVLNASLAGLIEGWRENAAGRPLYGARQGIQGLLGEDYFDLARQSLDVVRRIGHSPGSAIGSSRRRLEEADYERRIESFRRRGVRYFFYTGGNGSMGTALAVEQHARAAGYELTVVGIPKTIENDLFVTDHTPGNASSARFFACAARDVGEDNRSLPSPVCVLEVLGRNAG